MTTPALPIIPSALTPANRGNLRLKSLSLRELNDVESLSLAVDLTVSDQRLQFTSSFDDGTSVNMFSMIGSTTEVTTLSVSSILAESISASGNFALNELSVHAISSQLSVGGETFVPVLSAQVAHIGTLNIFEQNTLSVGGNVVFAGGEFLVEGVEGKFQISREISAGASIIGAQSLSVGGTGDFGGRLSVAADATIDSYASIGGFVTIQGAYVEVAGDLSVGGNDTTLDTNLSVSGALAVRQDAVFDEDLSVNGNLTTASKLSVGSAVRLSSILHVMDSSTFHAKVSVHGPLDVEGTVSVGEAITAASTLSVQGLSTIGTLSAGVSTLDRLNVRTNLSVAGDLIVEGNTITLNTSQVDIEDPIIEIGQGLAGETLAGIKIIKDTTASNDQSGFFRERASDDGTTPSFFAVYEVFFYSDTLNVVKNVGNFRTAQLSTSAGAFLGGALSVGGHVDVMNSIFVKENLSLSGFIHTEGDVSVGGSANVDGDLEMNGALSIGSDVTAVGRLSVQGSTDIVGVVQIASELSVSQSVTFADDLSVASDVQIDGKLRLQESLSVGNFAIVDGTLSVSGSVVVDDYISVSGYGTVGQSLSVSDVAVMTPSSGNNVFLVNAESAGLITLTADNSGDAIHQMEFDESPIQVTIRQSGKLDIVYNEAGTVTGPPIAYDSTIGKWVLPLQYINGTVNPVLVPQEYEIEMTRPYVPKTAFKIRNLLTQTYVHDLSDIVPKNMFTPDSGHIVPTVSVSGDLVTGSAISVGHDLHCHGNTLFSNASKRVGIRGKLSVHDDVNINQRLIVGGRADSFLSIGSLVTASSSLSVGGPSVFSNDVSIGQAAFFEENVTIKDTLSVASSLEIVGKSVFNDTVSVAGLVVIDDDLSVSFNQVVGVDLSVGSVVTTQMLSVQELAVELLSAGASFIEHSLINSGTSDLYDVVQIGSVLSVSGNVYHTSSLSVGDNVDFASDVFVNGKLSVTDSVTIQGDVVVDNTLDVSGATRVNDTLSVTGALTLASTLSVSGASEFTSNVFVRETETINKQLSVGRQLTVSRQLSVADTITGGRDLSVGGLILDRERTKNRYFLIGQPSNTGLQIKTTSAGQEFLFNLADGRLVSVFSFQDGPDFVVRSPTNISVEWIEVNASFQESDFLEVRGLVDNNLLPLDFSTPGSGPTAPVLAGLTALSVGHNMTIGKDGQATFLSVGSSLDVTGRTQIGNTLSVSDAVFLASTLSTNGDLDVVTKVRVGESVSVGGLGIFGSTLSIQGDTTISSKLSVQGDLDVLNPVRFANDLSVNGELDVKEHTRLHSSLSVQGLTTINDSLSVAGHLEVRDAIALGSHISVAASATVGTYLSVHTFAGIGGYMEVGDRLSVGDELAVVGKTELNSTLSVNSFTFIGDAIEVESHTSIGGNMEVAGQISVGELLAVTGNTSVGGSVILSESLSVASLLITPASGVNNFVFNQPITSSIGAVKLRIELSYPHILKLLTNSGEVGRPAAVQTAQGTFVTEVVNSAGVTDGIGQISGFKLDLAENSSVPQLRYMTEHEVINVEYELGNGDVTVLHNNISTPGLTGGQRAPTLSVGGRIILLEDLSVGFDTTIAGKLSVSDFIITDTLSVAEVITSNISTNTLFVAQSDLNDVSVRQRISVHNAFIDFANIKDSLSVGGPTLFNDDILMTGQTLTLEKDLSVGGDAQMNLISVANLHAHMLSVSDAYASELSVHTLFVQQVTTTDPDETFDFQDDAHFQGDLTIEGKLFVKDIIYTGPGGAFTIENIAGLTVSGSISTASLFLDITNPPATSGDPGTAGIFTVDTQYLYVCVADNTWRRVTMSAF